MEMGSLLERFRRPIAPGKHVQEIDGLRALAIATVVVAHVVGSVAKRHELVTGETLARSPLRQVLIDGHRGVVLFFLISGFVLAMPFVRAAREGRTVPLRPYLLRRLTRLEPPYILSLAIFLVGQAILLRQPITEGLPHFLLGLPYLHVLALGKPNPINSVSWSLEVEVTFYIVMPFLAAILLGLRPSRIVPVLIAVVAFSLGLQQLAVADSFRWSHSLLGSLHGFVVGIAMAWLFQHRWDRMPPVFFGDLAFLGGLCLFALLTFLPRAAYPLVLLGSCSLLLYGSLRGKRATAALRTPMVWVIGGMCYSIYLVHLQVIRLLWRPLGPLVGHLPGGFPATLIVELVLMVPVILAASAAFFWLVELPCMRWSQRASVPTREERSRLRLATGLPAAQARG